MQADYSFSQSLHCSLPSEGTFPTLFSDSDRHLPATVCLDLTNSPQFLFDKRRRLVAKQELIANVAEYEQDLASEKKPGMEKVSQGNNLLCKVLSVSVKLETGLSSTASQCPLVDREWRVMLYKHTGNNVFQMAYGFTKQNKFILSHSSILELLSIYYYIFF